DAAAFLVELCTSKVQHVVLAHLSETNNHPDLVTAQVQQELAPYNPTFSLDLARQDQPGRFITMGKTNKERGEVESTIADCIAEPDEER
ncbi:hypothetical protein VU10_08055, partial [Desulfobulbus sp. US1]|nr:hypothetical protein [Desulfobulbus sp. US1]